MTLRRALTIVVTTIAVTLFVIVLLTAGKQYVEPPLEEVFDVPVL